MPPPASLTEQITGSLLSKVPAGRTMAQHTNFFEAGLTSRQLVAALAELTSTGVPVRLLDFFRYPTIAQLAAELDARMAGRTTVRASAPATMPWES